MHLLVPLEDGPDLVDEEPGLFRRGGASGGRLHQGRVDQQRQVIHVPALLEHGFLDVRIVRGLTLGSTVLVPDLVDPAVHLPEHVVVDVRELIAQAVVAVVRAHPLEVQGAVYTAGGLDPLAEGAFALEALLAHVHARVVGLRPIRRHVGVERAPVGLPRRRDLRLVGRERVPALELLRVLREQLLQRLDHVAVHGQELEAVAGSLTFLVLRNDLGVLARIEAACARAVDHAAVAAPDVVPLEVRFLPDLASPSSR